MNKRCEICHRREGTLLERDMETRRQPPLGDIEKCDTCGRMACPDCMHEADCCFVGEDENSNNPTWSPKGWTSITEPDGTKNWRRAAKLIGV